MRWREISIATLRDNPAEAKSAAHALLVRAGYMRIPAPGVCEWLFLGSRALQKIRRVFAGGVSAEAFSQCGIDCVGGNAGFRALSDAGGDPAVRCPGCGYVAGLDEAISHAVAAPFDDADTETGPEEFHTPDRKTIADIADFTGLPRTAQMKSLVMMGNGEPVLALIRGDHHLSRPKLARLLGAAEVRPAAAEEIRAWFGAEAGSLGPIGVTNVRIVTDYALRGRRNMITGANRNDYHLRNVTPERDFSTEFADLRQAMESEACCNCGGALELRKTVLLVDEAGAVEAERVLVVAAEQNRDELGLRLASAIAPFALIVTPVNNADPAMGAAAERIYQESLAAEIDTLYDDRDERPGVKFKDADLIGIPYRITIGKRLAQGMVELTNRRARSSRDLPPGDVVGALAGSL